MDKRNAVVDGTYVIDDYCIASTSLSDGTSITIDDAFKHQAHLTGTLPPARPVIIASDRGTASGVAGEIQWPCLYFLLSPGKKTRL